MKRLVRRMMVAALLMLGAATTAYAQDGAGQRKLVKLHRVVYYDIREHESGDLNAAIVEVAEFMKKYEDVHVSVVGYADKGTGNAELNRGYAKARADQFRNDLLKRFDVDPARISTDSKGSDEQPFAENDKNRCVIVDALGYDREPLPEKEVISQIETVRDTVLVQHTDTVWVAPTPLKEETPFGLNKENRWRNWFITFGVGPAIFQGDHNVDAKWKDRIYPMFTFGLGKWVYPALGFRANVTLDDVHSYYNANPNDPNPLAIKNGKTWYGEFVHGASPDKPYEKAPWLYRMDYKAWNFDAEVMINFSSFMWSPYNRRIWNLIGYFGVGCIATWDNGTLDWYNSAVSWNAGIMNSFRIAEHFDINLDLHLKEFDDDFNCFRQGRGMDGMVGITIGATWYFTKRGF